MLQLMSFGAVLATGSALVLASLLCLSAPRVFRAAGIVNVVVAVVAFGAMYFGHLAGLPEPIPSGLVLAVLAELALQLAAALVVYLVSRSSRSQE